MIWPQDSREDGLHSPDVDAGVAVNDPWGTSNAVPSTVASAGARVEGRHFDLVPRFLV